MISVYASIVAPVLIDAIAVLGLYVIANSGRLSVGHAAFFGVGAYAGGLLSVDFQLPTLPSLIAAAIFTGLVGGIFAAVAERLSNWFFAITTLAFNIMLVSLVSSQDFLGGDTGLYGIPLTIGPVEIGVFLLISIGFVIWLDSTRFGDEMRAVRDSGLAAQSLAIDPRRTRVVAFAIGTTLAGLAGALWAHYMGLVRPNDMSLDRSLLYLIYLSIGGVSIWQGAIVGTLFLGLLPEFLRFSDQYRLALFGLLLAVVMILRPSGLLAPRTAKAKMMRGLFFWMMSLRSSAGQ